MKLFHVFVQGLLGVPSLTVTRPSSRKPSRTLEVVTERIFEVVAVIGFT